MASRTRDRKPTEDSREIAPVPLKLARNGLGDLVNESAYGNRIVPITRRGKIVAALVGMKDLARLRALDAA